MEWTSTNKDGWDLSKGLRISCPFFFASKLYTVEYLWPVCHFCPQLCPRGATCPLLLFFDPYRTWHTSSHQRPPAPASFLIHFILPRAVFSIHLFFSFNFSLVISRKYFFTKPDSNYGRLNIESWTSHICTKEKKAVHLQSKTCCQKEPLLSPWKYPEDPFKPCASISISFFVN